MIRSKALARVKALEEREAEAVQMEQKANDPWPKILSLLTFEGLEALEVLLSDPNIVDEAEKTERTVQILRESAPTPEIFEQWKASIGIGVE